jgi:hypothetical protein
MLVLTCVSLVLGFIRVRGNYAVQVTGSEKVDARQQSEDGSTVGEEDGQEVSVTEEGEETDEEEGWLLMAKKPRNYRREYDTFHGKPEQVAMRAKRNKARSEAGLKVGDPREVDHKRPLSKGGSGSEDNTRVVSRSTNRKKAASWRRFGGKK